MQHLLFWHTWWHGYYIFSNTRIRRNTWSLKQHTVNGSNRPHRTSLWPTRLTLHYSDLDLLVPYCPMYARCALINFFFDTGIIKSKGKVFPVLFLSTTQLRRTEGMELQFHIFLTSALDGGELSAPHPGRFTPRKRAPGAQWIGGWVSPGAGLDAVVRRKIRSPHTEIITTKMRSLKRCMALL